MRHLMLALCIAIVPMKTIAQDSHLVVQVIVKEHILPRFVNLKTSTQNLAEIAENDCTPTAQPLRAAYHTAFDAWISASHLRFGPTEVDDRAFALAFWPDSRNVTPRSLRQIIATQDPIAATPQSYTGMSIAARGFYAFEYLLYENDLHELGTADYRCTLIKTVASDIAMTSAAILSDWQSDYASRLLNPQTSGTYRSDDEALQEMFKALTTGLQFTSDSRLGRPLGTYDRPHPKRAENWRSNRSARNVALSLRSLQQLSSNLSAIDTHPNANLARSFEKALVQLETLNDPTFAGVAQPQTRLKIEVLKQSVDTIRDLVRDTLGPMLGVSAGFNALDGD